MPDLARLLPVGDDQRSAQAVMPEALAAAAPALFQSFVEVGLRRLQRGRETKDDAG